MLPWMLPESTGLKCRSGCSMYTLKQVFEDHWFHADPHPGNLFVAPGEKDESGRTGFSLVFVDFGMAGKISPNLVSGLREMIFAVVERDGGRVIKAYQLMGVLLPGADIELLRRANERAFERFWGKTTPELMELRQTEAVEFLEEFRGLLYNNPFQLPDHMILLGRALSILNGHLYRPGRELQCLAQCDALGGKAGQSRRRQPMEGLDG